MPDPDPCQLFVDAVAESNVQIAELIAALDAALTLLDERLDALDTCRLEHSNEPLMARVQRRAIADKKELLKRMQAELNQKD